MGRLRCMLQGGGFDPPFGAPPVVHAHPVATAWPVFRTPDIAQELVCGHRRDLML